MHLLNPLGWPANQIGAGLAPDRCQQIAFLIGTVASCLLGASSWHLLQGIALHQGIQFSLGLVGVFSSLFLFGNTRALIALSQRGDVAPAHRELELAQATNLCRIAPELAKAINVALPPNEGSPLEQAAAIREWMDEYADELRGIERLDLQGIGLTLLPPEIGRCTRLERLRLDANQLTELPPEIGELTKLEELCINENLLTELPPEIGELTELRILVASDNHLADLPATIGELINLQQIFLEKNHLTRVRKEIGQLINLVDLYLDHNRLESVPEEIGQLRALRNLDLSHNRLTEIPDAIFRLPCRSINFLDNPCADQYA